MADTEHQEQLNQVRETLSAAEEETGTSVSADDETILDLIETYVNKRIEADKAVRYIVRQLLEDAGVENVNEVLQQTGAGRSSGGGPTEQLLAEEILEENRWIEFEGVVIETYDVDPDSSIKQQGRLADETGTVRFTIWENSDIDIQLEEGESYNLNPVVTNEFRGDFELKIANVTEATQLGDDAFDIDPDTYTEAVRGTIIDFQSQMGLIDRCPNDSCGRVLKQNDYCPDCGEVESILDLRTKAVIDDGTDTWTIFLDAEDTEALANLSFEDAKQLAQEYNDRDVVRKFIEGALHGEYLRLHGRDRGRRFDVHDYELIQPPSIDDLDQIKEQLQSLP